MKECRGCSGCALLFALEPPVYKKMEDKWSVVTSYLHCSIV